MDTKFLHITGPSLELEEYDAVEVYPCVLEKSGVNSYVEQWDESYLPRKPDFWSVALHLEAGHIETLIDTLTRENAMQFGLAFENMLLLFRQAAGKDVRLLQAPYDVRSTTRKNPCRSTTKKTSPGETRKSSKRF